MKQQIKFSCIILFIFSVGFVNAQKTIRLGSLQLKLTSPPVCVYPDRGQLVEGYFEVKKDTFYTYDVWYPGEGDGKEIIQLVYEAGALKDMNALQCEIDTNEASDTCCQFSIFLDDAREGDGSSFYHRLYTKDGIKETSSTSMLLIFCNDPGLLDKIRMIITEAAKR